MISDDGSEGSLLCNRMRHLCFVWLRFQHKRGNLSESWNADSEFDLAQVWTSVFKVALSTLWTVILYTPSGLEGVTLLNAGFQKGRFSASRRVFMMGLTSCLMQMVAALVVLNDMSLIVDNPAYLMPNLDRVPMNYRLPRLGA